MVRYGMASCVMVSCGTISYGIAKGDCNGNGKGNMNEHAHGHDDIRWE